MRTCDTCGNPIESAVCPYCDGINFLQNKHTTKNLEKNQPTTDEALHNLKLSIQKAIAESTICLRLIHGYGSSGKGGKIKGAVRSELYRMQRNNMIRHLVHGEDFDGTQQIRHNYQLPWKITGKNPGETFVIL